MNVDESESPEKKKKLKKALPKGRSYDIRLSKEARALKLLRRETGLSMRQVAEKMGCSDSYISQLENSRCEIPKGKFLDKLINLYGLKNRKRFSERCIRYAEKLTPQEAIVEALSKLNEHELTFIVNYIESSLANRREPLHVVK